MDEHPVDTEAFLNDIEGHLLLASARDESRAAAHRFTAPLDWLTEGQRAEVERRFQAEYLALARASWEHTATRGRELRAEYEATYRRLRERTLALGLLGLAICVAVGVVVLPLR
ncbi:hypothetical protein [Streptomyces cylindrosporus]|uniref:Uncharacterized protein n=1 Tax=Streptomyces cylindrosporus TaxID=2927583 RepID=A0ABS9YA25_9ACTN|nr:hypothetical protein [Streptomyces cylindrosporus]MCI3274080.1 hypothetical protein [Streptomyces cylindrosporus]